MIRIGLIGFGLAGRVFHAPLIASVEGLQLAAILERSTNLAAQRYPGVPVHRTLDTLLADRSLDLIIVATPSGTHYEVARQVLESGRPAVIDKPLCAASAQIASLASLAQDRNLLLSPFHNRLWDSDFRTVQKLLHEGSLGRLVHFQSNHDRWSPGPTRAAWKDAPAEGSGNLLDLGTHLAYQALALFGLPLSVSAEILRERPGQGSDDAFTLRLNYSGLTVTLASNYLSAQPRPRFQLRSVLGGYQKTGLDPQEAALSQITRIDDPAWGREPESLWGSLSLLTETGLTTRPVEPIPGDYRLFYEGIRDALLHGAPPPTTATEALRVAQLLEWARESSAAQRTVPCPWPQKSLRS